MKNFTGRIRDEILTGLPAQRCCRRSFLAGLLINSECGLDGSVYIRLTGDIIPDMALDLMNEIYGISPEPSYSVCYGRRTLETVAVSEKLSSMLISLSDPATVSELPSFFRCENCKTAFLGGLVLSCAVFGDPEKEARAELRLMDPAAASKLSAFFGSLGMYPGLSVRKGVTFLLFRKSETIEMMIAKAGAGICAMELMQGGLVRDLRKDLNRLSNCEVNNMAATAAAAAPQLRAIEILKSNGAFAGLPEDLRISAELREANPDASLSALCALHTPPLSRSGLNHRLEKIVREAEKYCK